MSMSVYQNSHERAVISALIALRHGGNQPCSGHSGPRTTICHVLYAVVLRVILRGGEIRWFHCLSPILDFGFLG
jgi:hypothetical protein